MKLLFTIACLMLTVNAAAQLKVPKKEWAELYEQGKFDDVYKAALKLRKKEYGKSATVDFFIAKSLCASGHRNSSIEWFDYILENYKIESESKQKITDDKAACESPDQPSASRDMFDLNILQTLASMEVPESTSRGKDGSMSFDCYRVRETFKTVREVPEAELQARLFELDQGAAAISKFESILGPTYEVKEAGRFVVVTQGASNVNDQEAQEIGADLQRAFDFYVKFYNLRPPDKLLTVCLLPGKETLQKTAETLHGVQIPSTNWGYSNTADLTLLGWADKRHIGTLLHELFHLMIRTDIGDAPPWLDEGIASLYEYSIWNGDDIKGSVTNWRTEVLSTAYNSDQLSNRIPGLEEFLLKNWDQFDGKLAGDNCNISINYAYGRHFIAYLQETNKLQAVFEGMKTRTTVNEDFSLQSKNSVEVIEESYKKSIAKVEKNFLKWLMPLLQ